MTSRKASVKRNAKAKAKAERPCTRSRPAKKAVVSHNIVMFKVADLSPYEKNPRKNDHAVPKMVKQIEEFGFRVPILAKSNGEVCDGHLRLKAAKQIGLAELPAIICDDLTEEQIKALRVSINQSAEWADWDQSLLVQEIGELQLADFDMDLLGFSDAEMKKLLNTPDEESQKISDEKGAAARPPIQMKFSGKIVPLTEQESADLGAALEAYIEDSGTNFGFVGALLAGDLPR